MIDTLAAENPEAPRRTHPAEQAQDPLLVACGRRA